MEKLEKLNEILQQMQLDIKLEVILADLVTEGLGMEDVSLISSSLFKRNYHRDIEKTEEVEYAQGKKKKLSFIVNREGIYDRLPEDLFHQPSENYSTANKEKIIQEIKWQNELEKASRNFFQPFEHEFYRLRVKLEVEERNFLFETNKNPPAVVFDDLWDFPDFLDDFIRNKLGLLIPMLHKIVGDTQLTAFCIHILTGDNVEVTASPPSKHELLSHPILGKTMLGKDSILGGEIKAMQSSMTLKIFIDDIKSILNYMPGGQKAKIHDFLSKLFLPLEKDIIFNLDFTKTSSSFILENDTSYLGRLNYTTVI